eukprot:1504744-Pyramimonas_sp.AAC.1
MSWPLLTPSPPKWATLLGVQGGDGRAPPALWAAQLLPPLPQTRRLVPGRGAEHPGRAQVVPMGAQPAMVGAGVGGQRAAYRQHGGHHRGDALRRDGRLRLRAARASGTIDGYDSAQRA